jgi:hypothetical protein
VGGAAGDLAGGVDGGGEIWVGTCLFRGLRLDKKKNRSIVLIIEREKRLQEKRTAPQGKRPNQRKV